MHEIRHLRSVLAPSGRLRLAVNYGNTVLVQGTPGDGPPAGIAPEMGRRLAEVLNVGIEYLAYRRAGDVFVAAAAGEWDLCCLAIEPERAREISFSPPYVVIEGTYIVRADSPHRNCLDLDQPGVGIAVSAKSAYDLFLSRSLKYATLYRAAGTRAAFDLMRAEGLEAMGGVRQPLRALAAEYPSYRELPDRFMDIRQALGTLPGAGPQVATFLRDFVEQAKDEGFVAAALRDSGQDPGLKAPAG